MEALVSSKLGIYLLVGLIALGGLYGGHRAIVRLEVDKAVVGATSSMEKKHRTALDKAAQDARKQEDHLRNHAMALERMKDEKISKISVERDAAIKRLSNRPSRPTTPDSTPVSQNPRACSGGELYKEDGEFLIREAAAAEALIIERDYYYNQYEDARRTLDEYSNSH